MKIPKYVELLISDIENFGKQLENREAKLYKWLEANQIDSNILDEELNNLMKATIKLMDFAFAKHLKKGDLTYTVLGSPLYMSPLLLNKLNGGPLYKDKGYAKHYRQSSRRIK